MSCLFLLCTEMSASCLLFPLSFFSPFPSLFRVLDRGRSADMARSTNKQTEGIKMEKNRADEMWRCFFFLFVLFFICVRADGL